jgi:hypothetical protein
MVYEESTSTQKSAGVWWVLLGFGVFGRQREGLLCVWAHSLVDNSGDFNVLRRPTPRKKSNQE